MTREKIEVILGSKEQNPDRGVRLGTAQLGELPVLQSALVQLAAFAQMIRYLNEIEPLDAQWVQSKDVAA
jgi:hypothetical protein